MTTHLSDDVNTARVRPLTPADVPAFLDLIDALADYEHLPRPTADARERLTRDALAEPPRYQVLLAERAGRVVGYAVYFFTYSTFLARPTLYLEDIFVLEAARRGGAGLALMRELARVAVRAGCGRMEWSVLHWNTPAMAFYDQLGAAPLKEWQPYRMTGEEIRKLAEDGLRI